MSTTADVVTNNSADSSERKRVPSEKARRIVLDMIDQDVNQYITDRSMERRKKEAQAEPQSQDCGSVSF